jgi:Tol biopolymer transport system component
LALKEYSSNKVAGSEIGVPSVVLREAMFETADSIYEALDGYGSSFQTIMDEFAKLKNNPDFDALYNAFGTRTISSGRGNIFVSDYTGDMIGAFKEDLSKTEIGKLNSLLSNKGIKQI